MGNRTDRPGEGETGQGTRPGHSPGPWRYDLEAHSSNVLRAADGASVAYQDVNVGQSKPQEWEANRKLLAHAPELLEMLREVEWRGSPAGNECPICERLAPRRVAVPGPSVPGMPGFVQYTGETKEVTGGHAPDCPLARLLRECDP